MAVGDFVGEGAGVPDAGRAAEADEVESEGIERIDRGRLFCR